MSGFSVPLARIFYQGQVASGAKINVYRTGTTTPVTVYTDAALTTPASNPLTCDSNGEAVFFVTNDYALRLYCTTGGGSLIRDIDPVYPVPSLVGPITHGQCRLVKSGANLVLNPCDGNKIIINGTVQTIPSGGVSLPPTGYSVGTSYSIYGYMNGTVMALEASTTGPATDATTGVEIKTGDPTRTYVGQARVVAGPAWADTPTQRFVRSHFNDRGFTGTASFTTARSTASTSYVEVNGEIRVEFLAKPGEVIRADIRGSASNSSAASNYTAVAFNGTTAETGSGGGASFGGGATQTVAATSVRTNLTAGYNYATLLGAVSTGTGTWAGTDASLAPVSLQVSAG